MYVILRPCKNFGIHFIGKLVELFYWKEIILSNIYNLHNLIWLLVNNCSCTPEGIISSLPGLMVAIRNVSKTAHYFNTPSNVTGLFVKISNQLTITSKNYLTDNGRVNLWTMSPNDVISKIEKCRLILESYKNQYYATCHDMAEAGEKPWIISSVYIFTCLDKFMNRLNQVRFLLVLRQIIWTGRNLFSKSWNYLKSPESLNENLVVSSFFWLSLHIKE